MRDRPLYVGRAGLITCLDGTTVQKSYDCCHLNSEIDRDGTTNTYTYDLLKRLVTTTRNGITISNVYDTANNVVQTVRFGTDNSAITNNSAVFDNAGRPIASTDALNNTTSFTNFCSGTNLVTEIINPDGSTRIQTNYTDGTVAGISGTATSPINFLESTADSCVALTEVKVSAGGGTNEWVLTETDQLGHQVKTTYAGASGTPSAYEYFNIFGQLTNTVDPDGVSTIYVYDAKGEQAQTIVDMNQDYVIDYAGNDRITATLNDVVTDNGVGVNRTRTWAWPTGGVNASNLVSMAETSADGLQSWSVLYNNGVGITNHTQTAYSPTHGYRIVTATAPDGSTTVTTNVYGQLISVTRRDANGVQLSQTAYGYDPHGRQNLTTDARNGTSTNFFNNADQITATATPSPGTGQSSQVISNVFDFMGRVIATRFSDNTWITNNYYAMSTLQRSYGSRTYPVGYSYDTQGRMATMTNWTGFPTTGARVTAWNYDPYRGYLTSKTYPDGTGPAYDYTSAARLKDRLWARGTNTAYAYDNAGELWTITYNDGTTPGVTYGYDRRGRQTSVIVSGGMTTTRTYNDAGNLLSESYSGGPLNGFSVTNGYDTLLRRTNLTVLNPASSVVYRVGYSYDAASRLATVSDGTNTAGYSYIANSPLVSQIGFTNAGALRMTTTKTWDYLNRLLSISSANSSGLVLDSNGYSYNSANQRTSHTNADGTYWIYGYDPLGQVTSGRKYWPDGTPVAGQQFGYNFDNIGNRTATQAGGDQFGANLLSASYSANNLNQYTSRSVPAYVDVLGSATNLSTVTVNNYPTIRKESYYRAEIPIANGSGPVYQPITNVAVLNRGTNADLIATNIGNLLIPPANQTFNYDQDGNTTNDSLWTYTWDGENRFIQMTSVAAVPAAAQKQLNFTYDDKGRRVQKTVSTWNGYAFIPQYTNLFIYDDCNLVAELEPLASTPRTYFWGLDISGWPQDADGVGGLLWLYNGGTNCNAAFDGNGNVTALINTTNASVLGEYDYDQFGDVIRCAGAIAEANPLRFSTKYQDKESGTVYYWYRYLNPSTGHWINRDPLEEVGGQNLYNFSLNDPIGSCDPDGRITVNTHDVVKYGCVGYYAEHTITPERVHSDSGYIIQKVITHLTYYDCRKMDYHYLTYTFWEIVQWTHRNVLALSAEDQDSWLAPLSLGEIMTITELRWCPRHGHFGTGTLVWGDYTPPRSGFSSPVTNKGTGTKPWWWLPDPSITADGEPSDGRITIFIWNCCCLPGTYTLFFDPRPTDTP
jgi:RHS repeat-associated protein